MRLLCFVCKCLTWIARRNPPSQSIFPSPASAVDFSFFSKNSSSLDVNGHLKGHFFSFGEHAMIERETTSGEPKKGFLLLQLQACPRRMQAGDAHAELGVSEQSNGEHFLKGFEKSLRFRGSMSNVGEQVRR